MATTLPAVCRRILDQQEGRGRAPKGTTQPTYADALKEMHRFDHVQHCTCTRTHTAHGEAHTTTRTSGKKTGDWIWFVWPTFKGVRIAASHSDMILGSFTDARAYLRHPTLGVRLLTITCVTVEKLGYVCVRVCTGAVVLWPRLPLVGRVLLCHSRRTPFTPSRSIPADDLFGVTSAVDSPKFHEACTIFAAAALANRDKAQAAVFVSALRLPMCEARLCSE